MATITAKVATANWGQGTNTIWVGDVSPTAADDVVIPSGAVITLASSSACVCRSLTVQDGGEIKWNATNAAVFIGDGSGGALTIGASATINITNVGNINFVSTASNGTTGWPVTTNGKTLPVVTFNGAGGKWTLQDSLTCTSVSLAAGHLDTNSNSLSLGGNGFGFTTTGVKRLTLGSSAVSVVSTGTTVCRDTNATNITVDTNTATFTITGAGGTTTWTTPTVNWSGTSVVWSTTSSTDNWVLLGTVANFTRNWGGTGTPNLTIGSGTNVVTGTLTISGANSTTQRMLVQSSVLGQQTIVVVGATSLTDVDFMDIAMAGPLGTIATSDSFNRADGLLYGTSTDVAYGGTALAWSNDSGVSTASNRARITGGYTRPVVDIGTSDQYAEAKLEWDNDSAGYFGLCLRHSSEFSRLDFIVNRALAGRVLGYVNGTGQAWLNTTAAPFQSGDTLGVAVVGNAVLIYLNGVLKHTTTLPASAPTTGTNIGIVSTGSSNGKEYADDFKAYPVPKVTGTRLGDCLGNTGLTFDAARTLYAVNPGNFSSTSTWSTSSSGASGAAAPLPQDDLVFDGGSANGTYTVNMVRQCKNFTVASGFPSSASIQTGISFSVYGNFNIRPGNSQALVYFAGYAITFRGRSSHTITHNGSTLSYVIQIAAPGGTYTVQEGFSLYSGLNGLGVTVYAGTFDLGNFDHTLWSILASGTIAKTIILGTGTYSLTTFTTSDAIDFRPANTTVSAASATIGIVAGGNTRSIRTATHTTFGTVTIPSGTGGLSIYGVGGNTFSSIIVGAGKTLSLEPNATTKVETLSIDSVSLRSLTSGTSAVLEKIGSVQQHEALDVQDITFNGTDTFLGAGSTIRSNVRGAKRTPRYVGMLV